MARQSGILYVTMQPQESLPPAQFHDWYNNEHGPGRLRLSFCHNGFRYRANDLENGTGNPEKPEWMAIYDISDMQMLTKDVYTRLRAPPVQSQRERDTIKQIKVDRRFYDCIEEVKLPDSKNLEDIENEREENVLVAVSLTLHPGNDKEIELAKWYSEEHVPMLQKVPGWRRTRRFVTSAIEGEGKERVFLALHEYAPVNGLGGKEFAEATTTAWNDRIYESVVKEKRRRTYDLYYTFGPAPRDLSSLSDPITIQTSSTDSATKTFPSSASGRGYPVIESYITTSDDVQIPYRLEGDPDPKAPLMVLANSILVTYSIWDDFITHFLTQNPGYRILRFNTRGRSSIRSSKPITVDLLAQDIISLLDALRVKKAAAAIGVSLGGATALNIGLKYPDRVAGFVACDTNSVAPASNPKAWGERVAVAEKESATSSSGENIVGSELAELTVRRWFVKESYDGGELESKIAKVKEMVATNSLEGFKTSVQALYVYDFREEMKGFSGKGAFLVGSGDGVLPNTMKEMAASLGKGAHLEVIEGAGHLPMVEKAKEVAGFVGRFISE
ncbi:alpha/beta-hydrolase [Zopfia rhizophila CBS 207.26]|uniref:Alpha/beta-hydrolase n=1 Tax=Zopfia rhizophila CBS 207.26 TaxID=1314779 RepID=A0A6A6DBS2_9PEZI|nr:alpha/beta-hydrolase [Zopfia rhizophila CBS 207.26]